MDVSETPPQRQARQFEQLRRAGIVAMKIVDIAGAAACAELEQDPNPEPPARGAPNPVKMFLSASAEIRHIIGLELRVEAGPPVRRAAAASADRPPPEPPKPDPRRPLLQKALHDTVRAAPDRVRRCREIDANIEQELLADPDPANPQPVAVILCTIGNRLNLPVDLSRLSDAILEYDHPDKPLSNPKPRRPNTS